MVINLNFVQTLSTGFGQDFEVEVQARFEAGVSREKNKIMSDDYSTVEVLRCSTFIGLGLIGLIGWNGMGWLS